MLSPSKKAKFIADLKNYKKRYLDRNLSELDESGTRIMINSFLSEVLRYMPLEEIKTEYMIKGTYADYVVQTDSVRHFLVEVKALSFQLSDKHLRQTVNYGANEGIEWAILTNGKQFDLYKIIFGQPIDSRKIFSFDLSDPDQLKESIEQLQYLHRDSVLRKGLKCLWSRCEATDPLTITGMIYSEKIVNEIRKMVKERYAEKCSEEEILKTLDRIFTEGVELDQIKRFKSYKTDRRRKENITQSTIIEEAKMQGNLQSTEVSKETALTGNP